MHTQRAELLNQLSEHGWRVQCEEEILEWWADEIWVLASTWSPVGDRAYVTFLVDPQFDGNRAKGEAVWAVAASATRPDSRRSAEKAYTLTLGHNWQKQMPDFFRYLSTLREQCT